MYLQNFIDSKLFADFFSKVTESRDNVRFKDCARGCHLWIKFFENKNPAKCVFILLSCLRYFLFVGIIIPEVNGVSKEFRVCKVHVGFFVLSP